MSLRQLLQEPRIAQARNLFKLALLPALVLAGYGAMDALAGAPGGVADVLRVLAVALLAATNAVWLVGLGVLAHEAVHRLLLRSAPLNDVAGGLAAALMLTPFHANRQFHFWHHRHAHRRGRDPEDAMHDRPFWQAFTLGALIGLRLQYRELVRNCRRGTRHHAAADVAFLAAGVLFHAALPLAAGWDLRWTVAPTLVALPLVFSLRALADHYGLPEPRGSEHDAARGWVIQTHPLLEWAWSSVNYHDVHHRYPQLPHTALRAAYTRTRDAVPYRVAHGYLRCLLQLPRGRCYAATTGS